MNLQPTRLPALRRKQNTCSVPRSNSKYLVRPSVQQASRRLHPPRVRASSSKPHEHISQIHTTWKGENATLLQVWQQTWTIAARDSPLHTPTVLSKSHQSDMLALLPRQSLLRAVRSAHRTALTAARLRGFIAPTTLQCDCHALWCLTPTASCITWRR